MKAEASSPRPEFYHSARSEDNLRQLRKEFEALDSSRAREAELSRIFEGVTSEAQPVLPLDTINRSRLLRPGDPLGPQAHVAYSVSVAIPPQPFKVIENLHFLATFYPHLKHSLETELLFTESEASRAAGRLQRMKQAARKALANPRLYAMLKLFLGRVISLGPQQAMTYAQHLQATHFSAELAPSAPAPAKYPLRKRRPYFIDEERTPLLDGKWEVNELAPTRPVYRQAPTLTATASRLDSKKRYRISYTSGKLQCSSITFMSKPFACALREARIVD
jgi:hypothetical protein